MTTAQDILKFWFEDLTPEMQFAKSDKLDQQIREKFLSVYHDIIADKTADWRNTPQGRLAEIIVLDQFSRNMFRNTAQAFAADALALKLARIAVSTGDDQKLPLNQRTFIYMPYMHSEDLYVHEEAMKLFSQKGLEFNYKFELAHKKIIDRFGRYPHRNAILGRESTPEEIEFLKQEGSSF